MNVYEALQVLEVECKNPYALSYARVAQYLTGEALRVQILYVLSNTGGWRGEKAREVKAVLKAFKP